jgi:hypothetical protein
MKKLFFSLLIACAAKHVSGSAVGAACSHDSDCQSGLFCEVRIPGGACTKVCTPCPITCDSDCAAGCDAGATAPCEKGCVPANQPLCPDGASCVQVEFPQATEPEVRCLAQCDLSAPCRTDTEFTCTDIGNGTSVCVPGKT